MTRKNKGQKGETQTLVGLAHEEEGGGADVVGDGAAGDAHRAAKEVAAAELGRDGVEARDAERAARGAAAQRVDDAVRDDDADGDAVARAQEAHERERRRVGVARQRDEVAVRGVHVALVDARVRDQHAAPQRRDHVRQHAQHLVRVVQHLLHKALGHLCPGVVVIVVVVVVALRERTRENQREVTRRKKWAANLAAMALAASLAAMSALRRTRPSATEHTLPLTTTTSPARSSSPCSARCVSSSRAICAMPSPFASTTRSVRTPMHSSRGSSPLPCSFPPQSH